MSKAQRCGQSTIQKALQIAAAVAAQQSCDTSYYEASLSSFSGEIHGDFSLAVSLTHPLCNRPIFIILTYACLPAAVDILRDPAERDVNTSTEAMRLVAQLTAEESFAASVADTDVYQGRKFDSTCHSTGIF